MRGAGPARRAVPVALQRFEVGGRVDTPARIGRDHDTQSNPVVEGAQLLEALRALGRRGRKPGEGVERLAGEDVEPDVTEERRPRARARLELAGR